MVGVGNTKKRAKISLIGCGGDIPLKMRLTRPNLALPAPPHQNYYCKCRDLKTLPTLVQTFNSTTGVVVMLMTFRRRRRRCIIRLLFILHREPASVSLHLARSGRKLRRLLLAYCSLVLYWPWQFPRVISKHSVWSWILLSNLKIFAMMANFEPILKDPADIPASSKPRDGTWCFRFVLRKAG